MDVDSIAGDHDAAQAQQTKLLLLSRRTVGVTVGRGMLTLASLPVTMTDMLTSPPITLAARLVPSGVTVSLDVSNVSVRCCWPCGYVFASLPQLLLACGRGYSRSCPTHRN